MILLWGQRNDPPLNAVAARLAQRQTPYLFVGPDTRLAQQWSADAEAVLELQGIRISLDEVTAVYVRPHAEHADPSEGWEVTQTLLAWTDITNRALVLNRPASMAANSSKPFQAQLIRQSGLRVPETLITTNPDMVRAFAQKHGEVVYKSISGVRSIVSRLTPARTSNLENVLTCPTQFQRYIPGRDIRVHVVGDTLHALAIQSDRDDYRYAAVDGGHVEASEIVLESKLAAQLRQMARTMELVMAGIDLRQTPSGEIYCLEVNPAPGFTYYEQLAKIDLASMVASVLAHVPNGPWEAVKGTRAGTVVNNASDDSVVGSGTRAGR